MSRLDIIRRYMVERYPARRFVTLAFFVSGSGFLAVPSPQRGNAADAFGSVIRGALVAWLIVLALRVWDDLEDRSHDALAHPDRITVRPGAKPPLRYLSLVSGVIAIALVAIGVAPMNRLLICAVLGIALAAWYRVRATLSPSRVFAAHVVLAKYPVIAYIVAPEALRRSSGLALAAPVFIAMYLLLCIHEALDDPELFGLPLPQLQPAPRTQREQVACYLCGSRAFTPFVEAEDDLTGKPGRFTFVTCSSCGLRYQNPRIRMEHIGAYYDDEYIAHRRKSDWGPLTGFFNWAMDRHDRQKDVLVSRYVALGSQSKVLDVGCAVGTFLEKLRVRYGVRGSGVDFKDLSASPALANVEFRCGLFYEQEFGESRFDLITMWHFLEHDYDPIRTLRTASALLANDGRLIIEVPRLDSRSARLFGDRWPGLQAPQHTVLYDRRTLLAAVDMAGLELVEYLPYGAFPAFFYFFAGAAFKVLRGRGLNLSRAIYPYFLGQILFAPILAFEKQLNFAMQTVVCRRKS